MFRVEFRFQGEGLWSRGAAPMTQVGAAHLAKTLRALGLADDARVVPSNPSAASPMDRLLDIKV